MASHKSDIGIAEVEWRRSDAGRHLCRGYERWRQAASISYAAQRIFRLNRSRCELTVEMQDGSIDHE